MCGWEGMDAVPTWGGFGVGLLLGVRGKHEEGVQQCPPGVHLGTGALQHLYQWHRQWDRRHPQQRAGDVVEGRDSIQRHQGGAGGCEGPSNPNVQWFFFL